MARSTPIPPFPYKEFLPSITQQLVLDDAEIHDYNAFIEGHLPPLVKAEILALSLGVSLKLLFAMALFPDRYYRSFFIPKRSGGKRQIDAPRVYLKTVQRWILQNILYIRKLPPFVTGFVPGRDLLANATGHKGKKFLAKIDVKDFFGSVKLERVKTVFDTFAYPEKVTNLLVRLSTFRNSLPHGAPTSPNIANLAFLPCDHAIQEFSNQSELTYTRYADDLTFSANREIDAKLLDKLIHVVQSTGFQINASKTRSWHSGQRLITTGMVVNQKVHPPRQFRRRLRATFHRASLNPEKFRSQASRLMGWAAFVNMYDKDLGKDYLDIARPICSTPPKSSLSRKGGSKLSTPPM